MPQQLSTALISRTVFSRALQYFARVATVGSIREASRQLNVSPSAVSRQIQLLQARLDVPLFYNLGNTLRLSPAGEALLDYCRHMNETLDDAVNRISALSGNYTGTLRVATVDSFANHSFAELLAGFTRDYPGIRVIATVAAARDVAQLVRDGKADIGFTFGIAEEDILTRLFTLHCPTRIVVSRNHPLADRDRIGFVDCLDYTIGLLSPSSYIRQELETASTSAGAPWPRCVETNSFSLLQRFALTGEFVTFQPEYPGRPGTSRDARLVFHHTQARIPGPTEEFAMIADRRIHHSPALNCFVEFAKAFLSGLTPPA